MDDVMLEYQIHEYCLLRYGFLKDKHVFVFGAGKVGRLTVTSLMKLGITVNLILDNDKAY
jgi:tRNA A37 threonylcarbamoyladenosine dehydratase